MKHDEVTNSIISLQEIRQVLAQFHEGYRERNLDKADEFIRQLFMTGEETYAVGTSTGELFFGTEQIKNELIKSDWEYWGNVTLDTENALIHLQRDTAWFAVKGSVQYTFEDTSEKYDRHIAMLKAKVKDDTLTPHQKLTYINWFLSLVYHQREGNPREYQWPLRLSGVLLKDKGIWRIANLCFSIPGPDFPDERFEGSKDFIDNYHKRNAMTSDFHHNRMNTTLKSLLSTMEAELFGQKNLTSAQLKRIFTTEYEPYILGTGARWYQGYDEVAAFFSSWQGSKLSLDLEHGIASSHDNIHTVTVMGTLSYEQSKLALEESALSKLDTLLQSNSSSKDKLFAAHRHIAYALKEEALGSSFTYPVRLTAVVIDTPDGPAIHNIHFSYPFYWIMEGKLDNA